MRKHVLNRYLSIALTEKLYQDLVLLSDRMETSLAHVVRLAVESFVAKKIK